jgi:NitT/TauT family transport system substrate-binding protein
MSTPVREPPDDRPSKDGPLSYAPKKVRHAEPEPNPAGAPGKDDVAPLRQAPAPHIHPPEPAEPSWEPSNQRPEFAGDGDIAELRGRLALPPDRIPEPPPPSTGRKYVLAGRLAGVAIVTALGFIGYRLGSAPPPGSPPQALPASQLNQRTLATKRSVVSAPQSAEPALALPAATNAIGLPSNEQKSRDTASPRTASQQLTVGAVRPLVADEAATLTVSAKDAGPNAAVVISGLAAGSALSAGTQRGPNTWQLSAEELERAVITPPRGFAGAMDLSLELRLADSTVVDRKGLKLEWMDRGVLVAAKPEPREHNASEITAMMRGAAQRMANGDVAGARLMYQRLAKEGEAPAALALAETYDPPVLRKSNITGGVTSDVALAQSWYEKAKALGSSVAAERLEAVARLDKVTFITDFGYNGRHAYFFEALDRGYYRDAGLEVKIVRGQGSPDGIRQVGAGNAMFGFIDTGSLILARANDQIPVKLVAAIYRKPPNAIFCREDSGLKKPKDLEGNAIADVPGSNQRLFPAFAKAAGFDAQNVRWVVANSESLPGLLATNKVPCIAQYTVGEALLRSQLGLAKLVRFAYADAGLSYYGNGIVATDATIASKPDVVHRFVAATVRGMKDAFADPAAAGAIMQKIVPQVNATVAKKEIEAVAELAQIPGKPLGEIDPALIDATLDVVKGAYQLATPVAAADVYAPGFVPK